MLKVVLADKCRQHLAAAFAALYPREKRARALIDASAERLQHHARGSLIKHTGRSEEHTSELQSLMRISYAVFCLKKKKEKITYSLHILHRYTNNNNNYIKTRT